MTATNRASVRLSLLFAAFLGLQWVALAWFDAAPSAAGSALGPVNLSRFWIAPKNQTIAQASPPTLAPKSRDPIDAKAEPAPATSEPQANNSAPNSEELKNLILAYLTQVDLNRYYPRASRKRGEEGVVSIQVVWGTELEITSLALAESSHYPRLDAAALELLKEHRSAIAQALRQRHPGSQTTGELRLPIRFSLQ